MSITAVTPERLSTPSRSSFRPEIQGLRALAVGLVLLFHLWPGRISGGFVGVDVFFVISGYLITGHLHREFSSSGTISVTKFWARRIMRLLPLAFLVLLVSFIALLIVLPETAWKINIRQMLASLFYVENWVLAWDSVDYMAADNEPSMVQHYWSLSIEEQFYFLLPLIFLAAFFVAKSLRKFNASVRSIMIYTLLALTIISFIISVLYTNYDPAQAYFVTPARLWEFSIGGLVALIATPSNAPQKIQNISGWAGILMIVVSAVVYSGETNFPGYAALVPVLGTALFLRYGSMTPKTGIYWWASQNPTRRMGDWSYAIYLWHWPLIIIGAYTLDNLRWPHKIAIIILTFILAAVSQRFIEDPVRHASYFKVPKRAFASMAAAVVVIALATTSIPRVAISSGEVEQASPECAGAIALLENCQDLGLEGEPLVPAAQVAAQKSDRPLPECFIPAGTKPYNLDDCSIGVETNSAELTMAIIGSSHAWMWLPMLDEAGRHHNWHVKTYAKSDCSAVPLYKAHPGLKGADFEKAEACDEFVLNSAEELKESDEIDVVITATMPNTERFFNEDGSEASEEQIIEAITSMWQEWRDSGKDIVVIGEVPHVDNIEGPTCVETNPESIVEACAGSYRTAYEDRRKLFTTIAQQESNDVHLYDPVPGLCDDEKCYSMVGGLIARYDNHHLAEDFVKSYVQDFGQFIKDTVRP